MDVRIPGIGGFRDVPVIELHVKAGDTVKAEDALITLESDKAVMDVPAPAAGTVEEVRVKVGDRVSEGSVILTLAAAVPALAQAPAEAPSEALPETPAVQASLTFAAPAPEGEACELRPAGDEPTTAPASISMPTPAAVAAEVSGGHKPHASPSVRRFARELGIDVARVAGSGPHGRILASDVQAFVKDAMRDGAPPSAVPPALTFGGGTDTPFPPQVDFSAFGPVEAKPLSRIQKISGARLARNWATIPHVTQFDEADVTDLEAFRVAINQENAKPGQAGGVRLTLLAFLVRATVAALKMHPEFNASLDGESIVFKRYVHIGFAADTPGGLVVPVIRDADRKGLLDIAREMSELAGKARESRLAPAEMQGGCFTISSLGGIGGTAFTPIINAPEVAILGVSKSGTKPKWNGREFAPRLMLPLSLSYDHRVIDGAAAARFTTFLCRLLADFRRVLL